MYRMRYTTYRRDGATTSRTTRMPLTLQAAHARVDVAMQAAAMDPATVGLVRSGGGRASLLRDTGDVFTITVEATS